MSEKLFYTMGEVAELFDVNQSLIRYWEAQFGVLRPKRNRKGNRLFTPEDIRNLKLIYHLVKERGMTLDGAKKAMRTATAAGVEMDRDAELMERLQRIRSLLEEVREELKEGAAGPLSQAGFSQERPVGLSAVSAESAESAVTAESAESAGDPASGADAGAAGGMQAASAARRPHRKKEEEGESKELFAFYEQSLF